MVGMFTSCAARIGQSLFHTTVVKHVPVEVSIQVQSKQSSMPTLTSPEIVVSPHVSIPLAPPMLPPPNTPTVLCATPASTTPSPRPAPASSADALHECTALGTISYKFHGALARLLQCRLLSGDVEILNSAWDGHSIISGSSRLAEIVFNGGEAAHFSLDETWVRVSATACFCIALKFNSSYAFERLQSFVKATMTRFTTLHYCIFLDIGAFDAVEADMFALDQKIQNAESSIVKRLQQHLFRLLFFTPCNSVEVLIDGLDESGRDRHVCAYIRNIASYAATLSHVAQDGGTLLLRKYYTADTVPLVSSAIFLVACEAIAVRRHAFEMPRCLSSTASELLKEKPFVALAVSIADLIRQKGRLLPVVARHHCDVVCKRLIDFDNISTVHENLSKCLKRIVSN